ncbi:MAG: hypothetical protein RQ745_13010 [Longimicrobiales bacterium]|nr:hypothetical protein [Longimicrobiales bacterium]
MRSLALLTVVALLTSAGAASAQIDARMFRYPDVSADRITFVYAGDVWVAPKEGGTAVRLSSAFGEESFPRFSPDGGRIAFMQKQRDTRTWKRYRGGTAPDIHLFDLATGASEQVTDHPANDGSPMWAGETLYFLSDRGPNQRFNLWARDPDGTTRQVTAFEAWDITYPAVGPSDRGRRARSPPPGA